jgi:hypothetical protein
MVSLDKEQEQDLSTCLASTLPRRKRRYVSKSRNGCRTCKLRHVRCDESRPTCRNCQRLGVACDGYLQLVSVVDPTAFASPLEKRSFSYFHSETRPQLQTFADFSFWDQLALQASFSEEPVRQLVAAIGAFHESLEATIPDLREERRQASVLLRQKATANIISELPKMPTAHVLLIAILLAFFDNISGNMTHAYKHITAAAAIVKEHRASDRRQQRSLLISKVLAPIVDQLYFLVDSIYAPSPTLLLGAPHDHSFTSFLDAHDQLHALADSINVQLKKHRGHPPSAERFPEQFEYWWDRFSFFLEMSNGVTCRCTWPDQHAHHTLAALYLEAEFLLTRTRLHCTLTGSDTTNDLHEDDFLAALDACQKMIQVLKTFPDRITDSARSCLGFRPVHFVSCWRVAESCRDPGIRRRALATMRMWRDLNTFWDTFTIADTAEYFIECEESGCPVRPILCAQDVPGEARIRILNASGFKIDQGTFEITLVNDYRQSDFIRVTYMRQTLSSDTDHLKQGELGCPKSPRRVIIDAYWLMRMPAGNFIRIGAHEIPGAQTSGMPVAIGGLFPQASMTAKSASGSKVASSKLWSMLDDTKRPEDHWNEWEWRISHPPFDRVPQQAGGIASGPDGCSERLEPPGLSLSKMMPLEERGMGFLPQTIA